jgi:hypothetical protein
VDQSFDAAPRRQNADEPALIECFAASVIRQERDAQTSHGCGSDGGEVGTTNTGFMPDSPWERRISAIYLLFDRPEDPATLRKPG